MNTTWLKKMVACAAVAALLPLLAEMPRSEWNGKVGACAQDAQQLQDTIGQLSPQDQCDFLAAVNDAIAKLGGSTDAKAAMFVAANRAAVTGATAENRGKVLAEVFATVPLEYLTVVNESFASDLFNRNANSARTYSDAEYKDVCVNAMNTVIARNATAESPAARNAFTIMMFVRASGDAAPNADLVSTLVGMMPEGGDVAKNEWLPDAFAEMKSYDKILGANQAGEEPTLPLTTTLSPMQNTDALLGDLAAAKAADAGKSGQGANLFRGIVSVAGTAGLHEDIGLRIVPRAAVLDEKAIDPTTGAEIDNPYYNKKRGEPVGYEGQ